MGEEAKQAEEKKEEKTEEKKEENAEEPKPPLPFVLFVDMHCLGCAKKIEKSILRIRGVEGVVIDMLQNQVKIKGVIEPQAVCAKIMKKTKRSARVLSPLPAAEGEPIPEVVNSQVSGLTTVELNVNMHCEACAEQLEKDTQNERAELRESHGDRYQGYVYRCTKKQAKIVPQPESEKPAEAEPKPEGKKEAEKPAEEPKPKGKKEGEAAEKKECEYAMKSRQVIRSG